MTEAEWLSSEDPAAMLRLYTSDDMPWPAGSSPPLVSERKLRLWAVAMSRQVWKKLDNREREAVEAGEKHADDPEASMDEGWFTGTGCCHKPASDGAIRSIEFSARRGLTSADQANLLREIVGNPWKMQFGDQHVNDGYVCERCGFVWHRRGVRSSWYTCQNCGEKDHVRKYRQRDQWLTRQVVELAEVIYRDQNWEALPVLADALEEVGCQDEEVLRHLRHLRTMSAVRCKGSWSLDICLGKS